MSERPRRGRLIVVSGPSGSGKTSLCEALLAGAGAESEAQEGGRPPLHFERVITCTTRAPRGGEVPGTDYHFLSEAEFQEGIERDCFAEYACVYGNYYGTPLEEVEKGIASGKNLLLNIDVQGAGLLRRRFAKAGIEELTTVFILPPNLDVLEARLRGRGTDSDEVIARRLEVARAELEEQDHYDHRVVNEDLDRTVAEVRQRITPDD